MKLNGVKLADDETTDYLCSCFFFFPPESSFLNSLLQELFYFGEICRSSCKQVLLNEIFLGSAKLRGFIFSPVLMHHIFHKIQRKKKVVSRILSTRTF